MNRFLCLFHLLNFELLPGLIIQNSIQLNSQILK
jgi:hypothetical protein